MVNKSNKFILTRIGGGPGYTLEDTDLWGLECALTHGLQDGYFKENDDWAQTMVMRLGELREFAGEKKVKS